MFVYNFAFISFFFYPGEGGGGGTAIYGLCRYVAAVKGMVFRQFTLG